MKSMTKTYDIMAPIEKVFEVLTEVKEIEKWSGSPAKMDPKNEFSLWAGDIHGVNLSVSQNKIEQDWKVKAWEQYSHVVISLKAISSNKTTLELQHTGIPDSAFSSIDNGWDEYYLRPVKELAEQEYVNQTSD